MIASLIFFVLCFRVLYFLTSGGRQGTSQLLTYSATRSRTSEGAKGRRPPINTRKITYLDEMFDDEQLNVIKPRVYRIWSGDEPLPCFDDVMRHQRPTIKVNNYFRERENNRRGFLYMRPPKCASTTVGGVNMRIARNEWTRRHPQVKTDRMQFAGGSGGQDRDTQRGDETSPMKIARMRHEHHRFPTPRDQQGASTWDLPESPSRPHMCDLSFSHGGKMKGRRFKNRSYADSYLWTIIREPTSRHVSFFWFWGVSANHKNTSDESFQEFLLGQVPDYYFTFLSPRFNLTRWRTKRIDPGKSLDGVGDGSTKTSSRTGYNSTMTLQDQLDEAAYVLNEYDYIGITERLDESLVVLGMLLNVPLGDLLYYSAKASDNFYIDPETKNKCIVIQRSVVSPGMKEFFVTQEWKDRVYSDAILYRAAERSLDRTIDVLGRDEVEERVRRLRDAQELVVKRCRGKIKMECEVEGNPPNKEFDCLHHDMGCGMTCLDQVATELDLW